MKTDLTQILAELRFSKETGVAIGIRTSDEERMIVTAVDEIIDLPDNNHCIILKSACLYGTPLPKQELFLNEIKGVVKFRIFYSDPLYVRLRSIKENIRRIKSSIHRMDSKQAKRMYC